MECAVIGWRESTKGGSVASLVLGLREPDGSMRHVGHTRGFTAKRARELVEMLRPLETGEFGEPGPSRWSGTRERESTWRALRPQLVAEVAIDHVSDGRIRHGARFLRWRDDKTPDECGIDQLDG
jgi:ATP-dependent DNA ligase